ncbi:MAG: AAA family ATPase [archaeon]
MPGNVFAKRAKANELFRDERFLYPEFVPERMPFRDAEIDALVFSLQPVLQGKKPQNVFVCGKSGTGKTATVKFVLNELQQYSDRAKGLYVNCFQLSTRHSILTQIANFLGDATPRRGIATDEAFSKMLEAMKHASFIPVVVLDEADQLLHDKEASKLFYDLLRVVEYGKGRFGLIFISNVPDFVSMLDERVKSSLSEQTISFEPYSPQQLKEILNQRVQYAFQSNALDAETVNVAAAHAAKLGGDARIAIECLLRAGREAEKENAEKVSVQHLRKIFSEVDSRALQKAADFLTPDEKLILSLVPANSPIASGDLFGKYEKASKEPLTQRRFRTLISGLEKKNLVNAEIAMKEPRGRTRMISLAFPKTRLEEKQ